MRKTLTVAVILFSAITLAGCTAVPTPDSFLSPANRIKESNDIRSKEEVRVILGAIQLYQVDHDGKLPTAGGKELPNVSVSNIMEIGAPVSELDGISPAYMASLPLDPHGDEYRIGQIGGVPIVAGMLSDGSIYTETSN